MHLDLRFLPGAPQHAEGPTASEVGLSTAALGQACVHPVTGACGELALCCGGSLCTAQGTLSLRLLPQTGAKSETANKAIAMQSVGRLLLGSGSGGCGLYQGRTLTHQGWRLAC